VSSGGETWAWICPAFFETLCFLCPRFLILGLLPRRGRDPERVADYVGWHPFGVHETKATASTGVAALNPRLQA